MPSPNDYKEFAKVQLSDEEFQLLKSCANSVKFQFLKVPGMNTELFCDVSTGRCRPFVPKEFRRRIVETLHNISHPGVKATVKLVGDRFLWPGYIETSCRMDSLLRTSSARWSISYVQRTWACGSQYGQRDDESLMTQR
ncbi:hypothetical protein AVEN_97657-1 [Araneus ventricosus]|uniref:Integrase zinc-binding domain-containing protein n=1 Tax=Araneus ventricosus TaxID=182803 RepID=A0A4Y2GXM4_ARAVE|nr:hypothetical protein AVEN_97657-1 [Araneus ventricosus]